MSNVTLDSGVLPSPERRRELAKLIPPLTEGLETDAAEFRRLVRSFARRLEEWGGVQAMERLNLDGLLALWHPPLAN